MSKYERKAQSARKHGPLSISGASKAPISPPIHRPGWKGPGYVKKQPSSRQTAPSTSNASPTIQEQLLPVSLQQLILDIFRDTFPASQDFETLKPSLRDINDALLQNDFSKAFGSPAYREAYAVRWSPSRSLAYANALAGICNQERELEWIDRLLRGAASQGVKRVADDAAAKVICFGGGAAEVIAFAALLRHINPEAAGKPDRDQSSREESASEHLDNLAVSRCQKSALLNIHLVDAADWSVVVSSLRNGLTTPPILSKYASATARASNAALLSLGALSVAVNRQNVFELSIEHLRNMIGPDPTMLTLFLTLNDLYTASIPKTTAFLRKVTIAAPKGSLLVVMEKLGACVEISSEDGPQSNGEKNSYDVHWLMDRALLDTTKRNVEEQPEVESMWEKVVEESNRYHRLEEKLRYPASLENMKFQIHLFRRL